MGLSPSDADAVRDAGLLSPPAQPHAPSPIALVRAGHAGDHAFIVKSWTRSNLETSFGRYAGPAYEPEMRALILGLLSQAEIRIAHVPDDAEAIMGFAVLESAPLLHYVYVRGDARRLGIGKMLVGDLADKPVVYTHKIEDKTHFRTREHGLKFPIPRAWVFNPFHFLRGAQ